MKNIKLKNNIIHIHQLGFPINLEIIIPKDDSVRTLYEVTEGLDYSKLYEAYSTEGRNPMILPETLFRIVAYGYMEGIYSSRKLEKACKRDINFRWLLQGQKEPSHNTIARFRSKRLEEYVEDLFSQFIIELEKRNEIEFENLFVDGTKIEANANRYSFVWKKATDKFDELSSKAIDEPSKIKAEFSDYLSRLKAHELKINNTENKVYVNSINILRRNPNARAKRYEEAMREVKNLDKNLSDK